MTAAAGTGTQWLLDLHGCAATACLAEAATLEALCAGLVARCGLLEVGRKFHQFDPQGVTGVILLSESHLAIHTWPEQRFAAVDLYVCDHTRDNAEKGQRLCDLLLEALQPAKPHVQRIQRSGIAFEAVG